MDAKTVGRTRPCRQQDHIKRFQQGDKMNESEFKEAYRTYERHVYGKQEMHCPVDRPSRLFDDIFKAIGIDYTPQVDEWGWEEFLEKVNASLQGRLCMFHAASINGGMPRMFVNIFCDGKQLRLRLKMSTITYPSDMNTGALFDWLRDFVLGAVLNADMERAPLLVRIDDEGLETHERMMIAATLEGLNEFLHEKRYIIDIPNRWEDVSVFIDLDYMDGIGGTDYPKLVERIRARYDCCYIRAYTSGTHRENWMEFMEMGVEPVSVMEAPQGYRGYDASYKLVIDAMEAIRRSDRIVVVSGDRNLISLCFAVHKNARKIDFIIPDEQTDINFIRQADNVLDLELKDYVMEGRA